MTTTTQRKPKKGDTIYIARVWSDGFGREEFPNYCRQSISIRQLRVESWGKQQATFTDPVDGEFIRERGYTEHYSYVFDPADLAGDIANLKAKLRSRVEWNLRNSLDWREKYGSTARPDVLARHHRQFADVSAMLDREPVVAEYHELKTDNSAQWAARKA